jgi:hypothetical protein
LDSSWEGGFKNSKPMIYLNSGTYLVFKEPTNHVGVRHVVIAPSLPPKSAGTACGAQQLSQRAQQLGQEKGAEPGSGALSREWGGVCQLIIPLNRFGLKNETL